MIFTTNMINRTCVATVKIKIKTISSNCSAGTLILNTPRLRRRERREGVHEGPNVLSVH